MRIVVAPDKFKGVLSAPAAAEAIAAGIARCAKGADIDTMPMADGGEGTLDILVKARQGQRRLIRATGPLGEPIEAPIGLVDGASAAVIELATLAGYSLVPPERRDPLRTTTYGVGEAIRAAVETGVERITLAIGGSATVDGGAGMMQALGLVYLDERGRRIEDMVAGGDLERIDRAVWERPPEGLEHVEFTVACDVLNPLCGERGAARVFAPQKGADAASVARLERGLAHWDEVLARIAGVSHADEPGMGAAGGAALPLASLLGARLVPGVDLVAQAYDLQSRVVGAELTITGEGRLDGQSLMGKVVGAVGRLCQGADVPCVAIVGAAGEGADSCLEVLDRYYVLEGPMERTAELLEQRAEEVARELCV